MSTAKHNKKSTEAEPAEFNRAPGRTARDLLFFNVKQNMIRKKDYRNGLPQPAKKSVTTCLYKSCPGSAGKVNRNPIFEPLPFSSMSAGDCPLCKAYIKICFASCPVSAETKLYFIGQCDLCPAAKGSPGSGVQRSRLCAGVEFEIRLPKYRNANLA